ncbi:MAG: nitrate reductase subunit beta [Actinobacteria bacterium]|nr:nitrate reductase subunit beta [Actinomycetota bacterium]
MNVRAQISMLFHLDKCLGCHTCSVACKNLWTDPRGSEYMWWNNVETRPGTGYPTLWEDQTHYRGGWVRRRGGGLKLRLHSRPGGLANLFFNPALPSLDDYYEPFTYRYQDLFAAPAGTDQPTAEPISAVTGEPLDIQGGPNWDDDLGGSALYARNDPNLTGLSAAIRAQLETVERVVFSYVPRICNHCLNPACVAACPSGAIYKRGEDGVVLVNEQKCRGWRMCVAACPYKKVYNNWTTGKSEKCILCFPRLETHQAPGCAHSCVGRIRYLGVLLYDADRIPAAADVAADDLVNAQLDVILDPRDPVVVAAARENGVPRDWLEAATRSPVYRFVKEWGLALPLHPEFRTLAMMFYVPPLSPLVSTATANGVALDHPPGAGDFDLLADVEAARLPVRYLAAMFTGGDEQRIRLILRRLLAVRAYKRGESVQGAVDQTTLELLHAVGMTARQAEDIYRLTTVAAFAERFVLPRYHRETAVEPFTDLLTRRAGVGLGYSTAPKGGA